MNQVQILPATTIAVMERDLEGTGAGDISHLGKAISICLKVETR